MNTVRGDPPVAHDPIERRLNTTLSELGLTYTIGRYQGHFYPAILSAEDLIMWGDHVIWQAAATPGLVYYASQFPDSGLEFDIMPSDDKPIHVLQRTASGFAWESRNQESATECALSPIYVREEQLGSGEKITWRGYIFKTSSVMYLFEARVNPSGSRVEVSGNLHELRELH